MQIAEPDIGQQSWNNLSGFAGFRLGRGIWAMASLLGLGLRDLVAFWVCVVGLKLLGCGGGTIAKIDGREEVRRTSEEIRLTNTDSLFESPVDWTEGGSAMELLIWEPQDSAAWAVVPLQVSQVVVGLPSQVLVRWEDLVDDTSEGLDRLRIEDAANLRLLQLLAMSHDGLGEGVLIDGDCFGDSVPSAVEVSDWVWEKLARSIGCWGFRLRGMR
ncbi:hypothetical protein LOK49_LG09G01307 [Camellia lanceoleosa]|uniref:Uncharacterized protein n=1 Tax=Camellia lanceoleosa TaxID=1840588 RepID=A0ACC0GN20_9ERIC|nr:hypothetical protein LOK49_LG09G01307 [Camellia lanceoleosa]